MTFRYTEENTDEWAISDCEIIIIAENKSEAMKMLKDSDELKFHGIQIKKENLVKLNSGIHIITEKATE